ncbi:hypothetical protein RYX36_034280, partial [Vicia faba]
TDGVVGMVLPKTGKEVVLKLKQGDVIPVPIGAISWWFNDEINEIKSKEEGLVGAPLSLDESLVSKIRYYRDTYGIYYYLNKLGRKIYDDKVMESGKKSTVIVVPSDICTFSSSAYVDIMELLDEILLNLLANNHIREDMIMPRIDAMTHDSKDNKSRMRAYLKL